MRVEFRFGLPITHRNQPDKCAHNRFYTARVIKDPKAHQDGTPIMHVIPDPKGKFKICQLCSSIEFPQSGWEPIR